VPEHLGLPEPIRSPTRRAAGGGGVPPRRSSPRLHAEELTRGLTDSPMRPPELDAIDPDLVFKVNATTRLTEAVLETQGFEVLGEDDSWTYFVLLDEDARREFIETLLTFATLEDGVVPAIGAGLITAIHGID
jgi:hypothetical protein